MRTNKAYDFNYYNYFNYSNYRNKGYESTHYVAIVPADLRSAGNKYQDFQSAVFLFLFNDSMMQIDV